jgi:hypothetical protein
MPTLQKSGWRKRTGIAIFRKEIRSDAKRLARIIQDAYDSTMSEAEAVAKTRTPASIESLKDDLAAVGMQDGDIVLIGKHWDFHTDFKIARQAAGSVVIVAHRRNHLEGVLAATARHPNRNCGACFEEREPNLEQDG